MCFSADIPVPNKIHQNHPWPCCPGLGAAVEAQCGFPSTQGGICCAAAPRLGSTSCLLPVVPYLHDLLQATLGRRIPPGSIAFITKANVFYHPFHPEMKVQQGITGLLSLPWWAVLQGAPLPPQKCGRRDRERQTGAWSDSCLCLKK